MAEELGTSVIEKKGTRATLTHSALTQLCMKPGGAFFVYATPELAIRFAEILRRHLSFRHWIALTMKGTFRRGKKLYPAHYALLYFTKGEPRVFNPLRVPIPTCRHCGKEIKDYGGHRNKLDLSFENAGGWVKTQTGG